MNFPEEDKNQFTASASRAMENLIVCAKCQFVYDIRYLSESCRFKEEVGYLCMNCQSVL